MAASMGRRRGDILARSGAREAIVRGRLMA